MPAGAFFFLQRSGRGLRTFTARALGHRAETSHYQHPQAMSQGMYGPNGQFVHAPNVVVVNGIPGYIVEESYCGPITILCAFCVTPFACCCPCDRRDVFVPLPQPVGPQGTYAPTAPPQPMQMYGQQPAYGQQPVYGQPAMPPPQYYPQQPPPPTYYPSKV